jgi:hypothetical protein
VLKLFKKLNTPMKVQDFLDGFKINYEKHGDTCFSPLTVLEKRICHCIEAATLAALILRVNGEPPLLLDLTASINDYDHVVALFKKFGKWGAISKTDHAALRYREPIYNSPRELAMSYFHEYLDKKGRKSLRSYSLPVNLKRFDQMDWMTTKDEIDYIPEYLAEVKHFSILTRAQIRNLRLANKLEIRAGNLEEWRHKRAKQ